MFLIKNRSHLVIARTLLISTIMTTLTPVLNLPVNASTDNDENNTYTPPSGTLLLPLTPKLDIAKSQSQASASSSTASSTTSGTQTSSTTGVQTSSVVETAAEKGAVSALSSNDGTEIINENATLKGTIQIVADDTEFDQEKNTFLGTGNAVAIIGGQNSKLQADSILYDQNSQTIDARGNVSILRDGQLTNGSAFKFNVDSDEYLITQPETSIDNTQVVARQSIGTKTGVAFSNGTMDMPMPFYLGKNIGNAPLSTATELWEMKQHLQAYLPDKPSFKFKAKKMIYERYKEDGNLTVIGGRLDFGTFSVPVGKIVTSVGNKNGKTVMAISPYIGNNLWSGGLNVGPQFNYGVGKSSVFSWSPMVQIGGRPSNDTSGASIGLAGRIQFTSPNFQAHIGYGSVSNLLIGDIKARVYRTVKFQAGVNRFLPDGMLGMVRARFAAELNDNHPYYNVPYLGSVNFRTAGGWYQDNPNLVYISSTYAALHGNPNTTVMNSGYKIQEQFTLSTHPLFNIGDDKWGIKSFIYGGATARAYSTGNSGLITQVSPILDIRANRLRLQAGYTSSSVNGSSPFVFDEYIQGQNSVFVQGDVKLSKYLDVGGMTGYNMTQKIYYSRSLLAAIGPPDLKLIVGKDFILNNYRLGFNVLYGQPVQYDKLVFKGAPDQGQLGSGTSGI